MNLPLILNLFTTLDSAKLGDFQNCNNYNLLVPNFFQFVLMKAILICPAKWVIYGLFQWAGCLWLVLLLQFHMQVEVSCPHLSKSLTLLPFCPSPLRLLLWSQYCLELKLSEFWSLNKGSGIFSSASNMAVHRNHHNI